MLVDTPGFDDTKIGFGHVVKPIPYITHRSDADILETVASWLAATYVLLLRFDTYDQSFFARYSCGIIPHGILFFQRISDNRMSGTTTSEPF